LKVDMASAEREPIKGSGGGAPSKVQGQSPWSGDQGGEALLKLKGFYALYVERTGNICPFTQVLKVLKYIPNIA